MADEIGVKTLDGGTATLDAAALQAFRTQHRGPVLTAGDPGYDDARSIWNAMIDRKPALIARCTGTADVMAAVRFARDRNLLVSVKGGGHNIAGLAIAEGGLVLDLGAMRGVLVDPKARRAHAQGGCLLGDVDRETQVHGQAAVLGFVSLTGIGGLTTGGGFGYLTRRAGWTCDNLGTLEVVTPNGEVVRTSDSEHPELFWALRGGSGNFGIVTSFEFKLHDVGPEIMGGPVAWLASDAPEVLKFYRELTASAPRELTCVLAMRIAPPAPWLPKEVHGKPIIMMVAVYTGSAAAGEKVVAPIKALGKPVADICVRRPYAQMQTLLDATQPKGRRYYWKSEYLPRVESGVLDAFQAHLATIPSPHSALILFPIGGALNELPPDYSPVGNRDAHFVCNVTAQWERKDDDDANIAWARAAHQAIKPFSTGGVYVNFLTEDEGADRTAAAYGKPTLDRLASLKRKYDPQGLFRHTKQFA